MKIITLLFALLLSMRVSASQTAPYNNCAIMGNFGSSTGLQYTLLGIHNDDKGSTQYPLQTITREGPATPNAQYQKLFRFAKYMKDAKLCPCVDTSEIAPDYTCSDVVQTSNGQPLVDENGKPFTQNICTPDPEEQQIMTELECSHSESAILRFN